MLEDVLLWASNVFLDLRVKQYMGRWQYILWMNLGLFRVGPCLAEPYRWIPRSRTRIHSERTLINSEGRSSCRKRQLGVTCRSDEGNRKDVPTLQPKRDS
jgi:hypothetical protein